MRCPNCSLTQPESAAVCTNCGASLTEIVVGYADDAALDKDRAILEADGWSMAKTAQGQGVAIAATFTRVPAGGAAAKTGRKVTRWQWAIVIVAGVLIVSVIAKALSGDTPGTVSAFDACLTAQNFVKDRLKAPSNAKFQSCADASIAHDGDSWVINSYVDAENSFGAMLRNRYTVSMTYEGKNLWHLSGVNIAGQ